MLVKGGPARLSHFLISFKKRCWHLEKYNHTSHNKTACILHRWLCARLRYLHCQSTGDTTVLYKAIDMRYTICHNRHHCVLGFKITYANIMHTISNEFGTVENTVSPFEIRLNTMTNYVRWNDWLLTTSHSERMHKTHTTVWTECWIVPSTVQVITDFCDSVTFEFTTDFVQTMIIST